MKRTRKMSETQINSTRPHQNVNSKSHQSQPRTTTRNPPVTYRILPVCFVATACVSCLQSHSKQGHCLFWPRENASVIVKPDPTPSPNSQPNSKPNTKPGPIAIRRYNAIMKKPFF
ncbi:hypothetical protein DICA4_D16028 [Diutina catenulata]